MAERRSRRLAGYTPQHEAFDDKCFVCYRDLTIDSITNPSVKEMGCCGKYVHGNCYEQLRVRGQKCGNCRGDLLESVERVRPSVSAPADDRREMALASIQEYIDGAHRFREFPNVSVIYCLCSFFEKTSSYFFYFLLVATQYLFGIVVPILGFSSSRCEYVCG